MPIMLLSQFPAFPVKWLHSDDDPLLPGLTLESPRLRVTTNGEIVFVVNTGLTFEMPRCPLKADQYERLYAFNHGMDDQLPPEVEWKEIRIKPGLSEESVYRLLPSATDFEYSGYLSASRVRYFRGEADHAGMLMAKPCTFHSHPTRNPHVADIPSLKDIYSFLFYRHLRSITVGATKVWVWDKTRNTLGTVRKLAEWMEANHFRVTTHFMKKDFANWQALYVQKVMYDLDWVWPDTFDDLDARWPSMLRKTFRFKVRVFSRQPGADS